MLAKREKLIVEGARFGKLTAVARTARTDARRREYWSFRCACGAIVEMRVDNVLYGMRRLGWCSCPRCYAEAGGWHAIAAATKAEAAS